MTKKNDECYKIMIEDFKDEIRNKFKRFVVFVVILCLVLSGITGVASYSLGASQVGYTARDTSWTVDNTQDAIDELRDTVGYTLVGSIFSYMGNNAPFGYLACDGTEYNIADYPRLAEHFTSEFGSTNYFGGDGSTTFKVPDLRGEFLRGTGTNSHTNQGSGDTVGTHQDATENLRISINPNAGLWIPNNTNANVGQYNVDSYTRVHTNSTYPYWNRTGNDKASSQPVYYTSRPTNTSVLYIIKY